MKPSKNSANIIGQIRGKKMLSSFMSLIFSLALLNMIFSCSYFKVSQVDSDIDSDKKELIQNFNDENKYMVVHQNEKQFHLEDLRINSSTQVIAGNLVILNENHLHVKEPNVKIGKSYRYRKDKTTPLNEVHIYLKNSYDLKLQNNISIPLSEIDQIAVVDKNVGKSIISIAGSTIAVLALALIIVALTKSSCPFIYSHDGEKYVFNGELYPGNIIRDAQYPDYLKLNDLCMKNNTYQIRISNELLEVQHTDLAELFFVDHPVGTEILVGPSGDPVLLYDKIRPQEALSNGKSLLYLISKKGDQKHFNFNQISKDQDHLSNIILKFPKPPNSKQATLKLSVKNSMWLDYVFGKFNEKFGSYYNSFQEQQQEFTEPESMQWQESQNIPLLVYIKRDGKWELENKIFSTGPMAFRDIGLAYDLENTSSDFVEIKLESGFMFWELDHASLSFLQASKLETHSLSPYKAVTEKGMEVSALLAKIDGKYLTQKKPGEFVDIYYHASAIAKGNERSVFIKSKGYYNYVRDYKGIPDFKELIKFKQPGHFTRFSKEEFEKINRIWNMEEPTDYAL